MSVPYYERPSGSDYAAIVVMTLAAACIVLLLLTSTPPRDVEIVAPGTCPPIGGLR